MSFSARAHTMLRLFDWKNVDGGVHPDVHEAMRNLEASTWVLTGFGHDTTHS